MGAVPSFLNVLVSPPKMAPPTATNAANITAPRLTLAKGTP